MKPFYTQLIMTTVALACFGVSRLVPDASPVLLSTGTLLLGWAWLSKPGDKQPPGSPPVAPMTT